MSWWKRRRGGATEGDAPTLRSGSALALVVVEGVDRGARLSVIHPEVEIGRGDETSARGGRVRLRDRSISSRQAKLVLGGNGWTIEHLTTAANPTLVNGEAVTRRGVGPGDKIRMGRVMLELRALAIPFYDRDLEAGSGLPAGAQELGRRITAADGLVIASPEYNMSLPAVLKNAIDWLSRAKPVPLRGKTALLLSASPSLVGGNRGLWALRVPLEVLGVHVYPEMFSLATAHQGFRPDGELADEALGRFLRRIIDGFVRITSAHASQEKQS